MSHGTIVDVAVDDAPNGYTLTGIVGQQQIYLHVAQHVAHDFCAAALWNAQLLLDFGLDDNVAALVIVILYVAHGTHLVAIGIDWCRRRETADVIERYEVR